MKKSNNTILYGGLALLAVAGIATLSSSKKPEKMLGQENYESTSGGNTSTPTPTPAIANKALVLKKGSEGIEVIELQKLLSVSADGIFGNGTETALFNKKGVKQISLTGYAAAPNRNANPYQKGDKIMSNNIKGTQTYKAIQKANDVFYTNWDKEDLISYGQNVGVIRSADATKTTYSVIVPTFIGTKIVFVKAQDVKKY